MEQKTRLTSAAPESFRYVKPCSSQDCTGLIPAGPVDENELENYEELYPYLPKIPEGSRYQAKKQSEDTQ